MTAVVTGRRLTGAAVSRWILAAGFAFAGGLHLVKPAMYAQIVPPWLPAPAMLVLVSGVCEIAGGVGLLVPATQRAAGWGLIALLVAVFPANVQMWLDGRADQASAARQVVLAARLPLQPLLMWWVWRSAVGRPASAETPPASRA